MSAVLTLLSLLPFLLLIYLANVSERSQDARPILYLSLAVINGLVLAAGMFTIVAAAVLTDETLSSAAQTPLAVQQLRAARLDLGGLALMIGALLALAALLPPCAGWLRACCLCRPIAPCMSQRCR